MNDKKNDLKQHAVALFLQYVPNYHEQDIKKIKKIHRGFTNTSFLFITKNDHKFQVRLPHHQKIDLKRKDEWLIWPLWKKIKFDHYNKETGEFVKRWIDGRHPKKKDWYHPVFLKNLQLEVDKLQTFSANEKLHQQIKSLDLSSYLNYYRDQQKYLDLFHKLIPSDQDDFVLCHSDINPLNVLIDKDYNVTLIDFEWICYAPKTWDLANWLRETNFDKQHFTTMEKLGIKIKDILQMCYISSFFAYCWANSMKTTKKIRRYRKKSFKQVRHFFQLISEQKN